MQEESEGESDRTSPPNPNDTSSKRKFNLVEKNDNNDLEEINPPQAALSNDGTKSQVSQSTSIKKVSSKYEEVSKAVPYRRITEDKKGSSGNASSAYMHHMNVQLPTIKRNV